MKLVQLGFGSFGKSWFEEILPQCRNALLAGAVSSSPQKRAWIEGRSGLTKEAIFADLASALNELKPDALLCVTPPAAHKQSILTAIDARVPVICEKPITENLPDALEIIEASRRSGVPVIIAENYRYMPIMRRAREIVASGRLGRLHYVNIDFYRSHQMGEDNYHNRLSQPLLLDVAIHHFDCLRFITGLEATRVRSADLWDNEWSPYNGNSGATADIELSGGTRAVYFGSLSTHSPETRWTANWRVDGERGQMQISGDDLIVNCDTGSLLEYIAPDDGRALMLDEILGDLAAGRIPANSIGENIKTFRLAMDVIEAARNKEVSAI